jgi:hypothetical protein
MSKVKNMIIDDINVYELPNNGLIKLVKVLHERVEEGKLKYAIIQTERDKTIEHLQTTKNQMVDLKAEMATMKANRIKNEALIEELLFSLEQERGRSRQANNHIIDVLNFEKKKSEHLWTTGHEQMKNELQLTIKNLQTEIDELNEEHRRQLKYKDLEHAHSLSQFTKETEKTVFIKITNAKQRALNELRKVREYHDEEKDELEYWYGRQANKITKTFIKKNNETLERSAKRIKEYLSDNKTLKKRMERILYDDAILKGKMCNLKEKNQEYLDIIKNNEGFARTHKHTHKMLVDYTAKTVRFSDSNKSLQRLLKEKEHKIATLEIDITKWKQAYKATEERFNKAIADLKCKTL